jgi:hypothetical protein
MPFWTTPEAGLGRDPKRGFRFTVQFTNIGATAGTGIMWWAKTVDKPSYEISKTEHNYLNHKFNFPGRTSWNPISLKMVDPTEPDMAATLTDLVTAMGYHPPKDQNDHTSVQKNQAVTAVGNVIITQIDANGNALEQWRLFNAWVSKVEYGSLDYGSDDLTEVTVELVYDWAQLDSATDSSYVGPGSANKKKFFASDGSTDPSPGTGAPSGLDLP